MTEKKNNTLDREKVREAFGLAPEPKPPTRLQTYFYRGRWILMGAVTATTYVMLTEPETASVFKALLSRL